MKSQLSSKVSHNCKNLAKKDERERQKIQDVRQEILDLEAEIRTMPIVQKETKRVIREKEEYLREFYAQRVEKDIKIQQETQISKIIEGIF